MGKITWCFLRRCKYMKKIIVLLGLLMLVFACLPAGTALASIDQNLFYGLANNNGVRELQQYLIGKGFLTGSATGNFYSLTLSAVKKYQTSKNINATGYVGPLTRQAINADLLSAVPISSIDKKAPDALPSSIPFTGSLKLSQNASYPGQTVTAPQTKFKLADFVLANNTTEPVNLKKIQVDLAMGADLYSTNLYVTNLYAVYGGNTTMVLNTVVHNNYLPINYQLPAGQSINLSLYGDVNSSIPKNATINPSLLVSGTSSKSATNVSTNLGAVFPGQNMIFGKGELTVTKDNFTPDAKIYAGNQRIIAGKFKFQSTGEPYTISELKFAIPDPQNILSAVLSDDSNPPKMLSESKVAVRNGNNYVFYFANSIPILLNSYKTLTIYYDLPVSVSSLSANVNLSPVLVYVKAKDSRGNVFDGASANYNEFASFGGIALPDAGLKVNGLYMCKSVPVLSAQSSNSSSVGNAMANLYTFSISADPAGDISIKQIMFNIAIKDPNKKYPYLNNFKLFKGDMDYSGAFYMGTNVNNNYIGLTGDSGIGYGTNTVVLTFNSEETIPAGKTQIYSLKATTNNFSSGASASTYISSDASPSSNGSYLRMPSIRIYGLGKNPLDNFVASYNLLWSDRSAGSTIHSYLNGSSSGDWFNGFGVITSPLKTQTIVAQK